MHGITSREMQAEIRSGPPGARFEMFLDRLRAFGRKRRNFLLVVMLPTLIVSLYFGLIASDQFESEAHFAVRQSESSPPVASGMGELLSMAGGMNGAQGEAQSVADYLSSHDAVAALRKNLDLVARFNRPGVDLLSAIDDNHPAAETLLKYYRKHVDVKFNSDTGIVTLRVRSFRPEDSYRIVSMLLQLGEQRVNSLNDRGYDNSLAAASRQLAEAESAIAAAQSKLTGFRQSDRDINPESTGQAQTQLVTRMREQLASARAQYSGMTGVVSSASPQYVALGQRIRALEGQLGAENGRLTGGSGTIASGLGNFEGLRLRQEFAAKRYESAAANLEKAREQARKQQLFIVRVVEPNLPEKALFPERMKIILTVFASLLVIYSIGWLVVAGVREHAA